MLVATPEMAAPQVPPEIAGAIQSVLDAVSGGVKSVLDLAEPKPATPAAPAPASKVAGIETRYLVGAGLGYLFMRSFMGAAAGALIVYLLGRQAPAGTGAPTAAPSAPLEISTIGVPKGIELLPAAPVDVAQGQSAFIRRLQPF